MKKLFLIFCLNLFLSVFVSAQTQNTENPYTFAPDWEEFSIKNSEVFSRYYQYKNVDNKNAVRRYKFKVQSFILMDKKNGTHNVYDTYFFIFSEPRNNPFQTNKVLDFIKYSEAIGETISINNFRGKKFRFVGKDGFYHTILVIKSRNRAYIFQTTSELDQNSLSDNFFVGIRFHSPNMPPKPDGNGYGVGDGPGSGGGMSNCGVSVNSKVVYTPLIILSKPSAQYTDFARFYEIEGRVGIEVTYLENGELGEIKPTWKLPFGLTENALEAAKSIKFSPPTADGHPFKTTVTEDYVFSINEKKY